MTPEEAFELIKAAGYGGDVAWKLAVSISKASLAKVAEEALYWRANYTDEFH